VKIFWLFFSAIVLSSLVACAWVPLTPESEQVHVATQEEVASCERLGKTDTRTTSKVWIFKRSEKKVDVELASLARADAVDMGGTHVAPLDETNDGSRSFGIYRCPKN
jgi:hypothetical protein